MTLATMANSSLVRAEVRNSILDGVNLAGADAARAIVTDVSADGIILSASSFNSALLRNVSAANADIFLTDFSDASLLGVDLSFAETGDPPGSTSSEWISDNQNRLYPRAGYGWFSFARAKLCGVSFNRSTLMYGNFKETGIFGVEFDRANLTESDLTSSTISPLACHDRDLTGR